MARRTLEHNMPRISFQTHPRWRTVDSACVCSVCVAVIRDPVRSCDTPHGRVKTPRASWPRGCERRSP
eukprot:scaffold69255_cov66-Phaeocystis_antarctica.AAC.9